MAFDDVEVRVLANLRSSLPAISAWPLDNPLSFVLMLAPRTKGKLGELLLEHIAIAAGCSVGAAESVAYDKKVAGDRYEVKFSTEDPPRFQQVRDPRLEDDTYKYDFLLGISGRPDGLCYWLIPASELGQLMDTGHVTVQHAMSDTKWFLPSRTADDAFSEWRIAFPELTAALQARR